MTKFLMIKDDNVIVNAERIEVYIPKNFFAPDRIDKDIEHSAIATSVGDAFRIIALLNARVALTENDDISKSKLYTLNYPQVVMTYPSSYYITSMSMYSEDEPEPYYVLVYTYGDILMPAQSPANTDNCTKFLNLLIRGKLPPTIKYEDIFKAWKTNLQLNNATPGVPDAYMQFIIAKLYKDAKNPKRDFRFVYGKDMNRNDYAPYSIREAVANTSVFSGQIFEDMGKMMTTSVNMTRRNLPQERSPVEACLWM